MSQTLQFYFIYSFISIIFRHGHLVIFITCCYHRDRREFIISKTNNRKQRRSILWEVTRREVLPLLLENRYLCRHDASTLQILYCFRPTQKDILGNFLHQLYGFLQEDDKQFKILKNPIRGGQPNVWRPNWFDRGIRSNRTCRFIRCFIHEDQKVRTLRYDWFYKRRTIWHLYPRRWRAIQGKY